MTSSNAGGSVQVWGCSETPGSRHANLSFFPIIFLKMFGSSLYFLAKSGAVEHTRDHWSRALVLHHLYAQHLYTPFMSSMAACGVGFPAAFSSSNFFILRVENHMGPGQKVSDTLMKALW